MLFPRSGSLWFQSPSIFPTCPNNCLSTGWRWSGIMMRSTRTWWRRRTMRHPGGVGELGIAVLEAPPARLADMRDIAQELARDTGIATMVVKVPGTAAVVSTRYSRADLEKAQQSLVVQPDYGVGGAGFCRQFGPSAAGRVVVGAIAGGGCGRSGGEPHTNQGLYLDNSSKKSCSFKS